MFASVVLYTWPVVALTFFKRHTPAIALILTVIVGYLVLPEIPGLDLPMLPPLDKTSIPVLICAASLVLFRAKSGAAVQPGWLPKHWIARLLILMLFAGSILTAATNTDALIYGPTFLQALRIRDGFSFVLITFTTILTLLLGRKLLASSQQHSQLLTVFAIAGGLYAFLALYEIRMSPQLNVMVYNFFPHEWQQHVRAGGFRPIVFLHHGLWLAIFFCMAMLAAFGAWRLPDRKKPALYLFAGIWILLTLALSNSLGGFVIAVLLLPTVVFLKQRSQLLCAALVAGLVLTYPALRGAGTIPVESIYETVLQIDENRAASLNFRLTNEDLILDKASERPLFGWGSFGRNFVFDDETGEPLTVPDGYWILVISRGGWVQYIAEFGLLCMPILLCFMHARRYQLDMPTSILALVLAANLIDLLPNATATPLTWLVAGALWGRLELRQETAEDADPDQPDIKPGRGQLPYTRFSNSS